MSPQKYLRLRRMQRVRRALALADPTSATVTAIATAHGFWELGRFAGVYRSFYGKSPSQNSGGRCGEIFGKCIVGALPFRYRSMIVR